MSGKTPFGDGGRDGMGRFVAGNSGGPGNPLAKRVGVWRTALAETVTDKDVRAVVRVLVDKARAGEPWAVKELLDRLLGRPAQVEQNAQDAITGVVVHVHKDEGPPRNSATPPAPELEGRGM